MWETRRSPWASTPFWVYRSLEPHPSGAPGGRGHYDARQGFEARLACLDLAKPGLGDLDCHLDLLEVPAGVLSGLFQAAQGILPDGRIKGFNPSPRTSAAPLRSILWLEHLADYWLFTGNAGEVKRLLPTAQRVLGALEEYSNDQDLIDNWPGGQYWDWAPIERGKSGDCLMLTNALCVHALERLAQQEIFAWGLGPEPAQRAARMRESAHRAFWDTGRALYRDGILAGGEPSSVFSQFANSAAVIAAICPPELKADILRRITDAALLDPVGVGESSPSNTVTKAIVPAATPWSAYWLCRAFFETGLDIEAIEHLRTFLGEFDCLPTFPEVRIHHANTCLCQGASVGPAHLLCCYVLGVRPTAGGWQKVRFSPQPGRLSWAQGEFRTPSGPLQARWDRVDGTYELKLKKPKDIEVHVRFGNVDEIVGDAGTYEARSQIAA